MRVAPRSAPPRSDTPTRTTTEKIHLPLYELIQRHAAVRRGFARSVEQADNVELARLPYALSERRAGKAMERAGLTGTPDVRLQRLGRRSGPKPDPHRTA